MELQRILDTLRYGELANVYTEDKQDQLVTFINLGLTQLYSKFPISEKQIAIQQYPQISLYKLTREFARTNRDKPIPLIGDALCEPEEPLKEHHHHHVIHKYILDNPHDPFMGDVLFISSVYDETGHPIPLNDDHNPHSFFTPSFDTLQIPNANENETSFVIYRAMPKYLKLGNYKLEDNIYLPECLLEALTSYVGFKSLQSMGGAENIQIAQALYQRFTEVCSNVITDNLLGNNVSPTNIKLKMRGYV